MVVIRFFGGLNIQRILDERPCRRPSSFGHAEGVAPTYADSSAAKRFNTRRRRRSVRRLASVERRAEHNAKAENAAERKASQILSFMIKVHHALAAPQSPTRTERLLARKSY